MTRALAFAAKGETAMTDLRHSERRMNEYRAADPGPNDRWAIERRMRLWERASGILCALFLWAPMAAAAFQRAG